MPFLGIDVSQVRQVVDAFVQKTWGEVMADHVVSVEERQRLWTVVSALHLPEACVPPALWQVLSGKR